MSARDWISMGDELRVELDAIERELWLYLMHFLDLPTIVNCRAMLSDDPAVVDREIRKLSRKLTKLASYTEGVEDWYTDALTKLRSHGRALTWPSEPWSVSA